RLATLAFFFFNPTPTTEISTLSLTTLFRSRHSKRASRPDSCGAACPPCIARRGRGGPWCWPTITSCPTPAHRSATARCTCRAARSEEHTSELQSLAYLVCRLLLEKKKIKKT